MSTKEINSISRRNSCLSNKDSLNGRANTPKEKHVRESTRTETTVKADGGGRRSTTLYLTRSHSKTKQPSSPSTSVISRQSSYNYSRQTTAMRSKQTTFFFPENDLVEMMKQNVLERDFTFTGYDIMADCDPPDSPPTEPEEVERRQNVNVYFNACKSLGIIPSTYITDSLMQPRLVVRCRSLGHKAARAVFIALVDNRRIRALDLEDNWLQSEGAVALAELLTANNFITEINISENRIGGQGIEALSLALRDNQTVRKLDISGSNLYDSDAKYIADLITNNVWLRELRVSHNKLGEIAGVVLGPAIACNDTLRVLDLSWNHIRRKGATAVAAAIEENCGVQNLNLAWNGFSRIGCKVIGQSLTENDTLVELDLTSNRVDSLGVATLLEGLRWNECLSILRLGQNPITPDVALLIIKTIEQSDNCVVKDLDLTDVVVDQEFVTALKSMQTKRVLRTRTGPIIHKGSGIQQEAGTFLTNDPLKAMFDFISDRGYRVVDLFKRYDTDDTHTISSRDFIRGLLNVHLPLTVGQVEDLVNELHQDKDGKIQLRYLTEAETLHRRRKFRLKLKVSTEEGSTHRKRKSRRTNTKLQAIPDTNIPETINVPET